MIRIITILLAALPVTAASVGAQERVTRTGSRLDTDTSPRLVVQFSAPGEVRQVLALLEAGETEEAVEFAQDYVQSLSSKVNVSGMSATRERYFALNALCVALTKAGRADESIAACTRAIDEIPSRWTALNSRGTAHYAARRFELAAADYRRALEVAPRDEDVRGMIEHNLALAEQRLDDPAR